MTVEEQISKWAQNIVPWLLSHGLKVVIILISAYILDKIARGAIVKIVRVAVVADTYLSKDAEKKREDTLIRIFSWASSIVIIIITILMCLQEIGIPVGPLLAGAGIVGLAVGFGGQYLIRDIIAGFFIILENQYRIGDVVNFDGTGGLVEDISLRMTTLRDLDGTVHHVPHGEIKRVANLTKSFSRVNLNIGVSYRTDIEKAIVVINNVGAELAQDPLWAPFITSAPKFLRVDNFSDSAIILKILGETVPIKQWDVAGELRKRLKIAFDKEGIEIPFPQRVVHFSSGNSVNPSLMQ